MYEIPETNDAFAESTGSQGHLQEAMRGIHADLYGGLRYWHMEDLTDVVTQVLGELIYDGAEKLGRTGHPVIPEYRLEPARTPQGLRKRPLTVYVDDLGREPSDEDFAWLRTLVRLQSPAVTACDREGARGIWIRIGE